MDFPNLVHYYLKKWKDQFEFYQDLLQFYRQAAKMIVGNKMIVNAHAAKID